MTDHNVRTVLPVQAILGEGPVWVAREQALWFVDIKSRHIHRFDPATGEARRWNAPDPDRPLAQHRLYGQQGSDIMVGHAGILSSWPRFIQR